MSNYLLRVAIAVDQLANALRGGEPDETLSAWFHRQHLKGNSCARNVTNTLFFWQDDHCREAHESEILRRQMPKEYH